MDTLVLYGANYLVFIPPAVWLWMLLKQPRKKQEQILSLTISLLLVSFALAYLLGLAFNDPRPFTLAHMNPQVWAYPLNGFPSRHTLVAGIFAIIVFLYERRLGYLLFLVTLLVGIFRVVIGVHHGVDVLASVGICILCWLILHIIKYKK